METEDAIVLVGLDGRVVGHLEDFQLDSAIQVPGPPLLQRNEGGFFVLDPAKRGLRAVGGRRIPLALGAEFVWRKNPGRSTVEQHGAEIWTLPKGADGLIAEHRVLVSAQRLRQEKGYFRGVSSVVFDVRDRSVREIDPACTVAAAVDETWLLICEREGRSTIESMDRSGETRGLVPPPPGSGGVGRWVRVLVSPDGSTLLAQWSGKCEVPLAFLVPASGGTPRPVTGENGLDESFGLGWSPDARAVVYLPQGTCGSGARVPGLYLVSVAGAATLVYATPNADLRMQMWAPLP